MSERFVAEFDGRAVGVAVRAPGGFRFFSSDPAFRSLEGRNFPRVRSLMRAITQTGRAEQRRRAAEFRFGAGAR